MDEDVLDQVLALKASAKTARDERDWDGAIGDLQEAISLLRTRIAEASPPMPSWLVSELADAYGTLGGTEKQWGLLRDGRERQRHLEDSLEAYDEGFRYEQHLPPREANTYNRVNRLVGRVLLDPRLLKKDGGAVPQLADELTEAEEILTRQIESVRQKDPWAYCDLGTILLLSGDKGALRIFRELDWLRPPAFVYDRTRATLEPLCEVAADLRPDLVQVVAQLRRSAWRRE